MDTNRFIKTEGIVISSEKYRETSRILFVFTEKSGKIPVFAQSALKAKSGMLQSTDFLSRSNFILTPGKNFYYIKEAALIDSNLDLSEDIFSFFVANYIAELIQKTQVEEMAEPKIYSLILKSIESLKNTENKALIKLAFSLKYISFLGYRPTFSPEKNFSDQSFYYFSYFHAKIIEKNFENAENKIFKLSKEEIKLLNLLLYNKFSEIECINFQNNDIIKKLDDIIYGYIIYCTEITELKSQKIMKKLL